MFCARFAKKAVIGVFFGLLVVGCDSQLKSFTTQKKPLFSVPDYINIEERAGGDATVYSQSKKAYDLPASHLNVEDRLKYFSGRSFFKNPWVQAPATTKARDGLGPLFNTNSCKACHIRNGRGSVNKEGLLLRLSRRVDDQYVEDSFYGSQLQHRAVIGGKPEGVVNIGWREYNIIMFDGVTAGLRAPRITVSNWSMGDPEPDTKWSARIATSMIGLNLLEAISERHILDYVEHQRNGPGSISGRPSWVKDLITGHERLGRFGWKALHPTVKQQSAKAFSQDMGLTSSLYPEPICTLNQIHCMAKPTGGNPEVSDSVMGIVAYYAGNSAVPAPRNVQSTAFKLGRQQFYLAGCAQCHRPHWRTQATPSLAAQDIWPYTDLLIHDMGVGLAAQTGEGSVAGSEWRTPPLWGIGLAKTINPDTGFLHDGRARNILEAILWHGGEGEASRQAVRLMKTDDRNNLLYFLNSL